MTTRTSEQWLLVEPPAQPKSEEEPQPQHSTHIMLQPPNDSRKRAIERFGFTKVFQEDATQLDLFEETGAADNIVKSVLQQGRDGLIATLGVTGSGKVRLHTHIPYDCTDVLASPTQFSAPNPNEA